MRIAGGADWLMCTIVGERVGLAGESSPRR